MYRSDNDAGGVGAIAAMGLDLNVDPTTTGMRSGVSSRLKRSAISQLSPRKLTSQPRRQTGPVLTRFPKKSGTVLTKDTKQNQESSAEEEDYETPPVIDEETLEEIQEEQNKRSQEVKDGTRQPSGPSARSGGGATSTKSGSVDPWKSPPFMPPGPPPLVLPEKKKETLLTPRNILIGAALLGGVYYLARKK